MTFPEIPEGEHTHAAFACPVCGEPLLAMGPVNFVEDVPVVAMTLDHFAEMTSMVTSHIVGAHTLGPSNDMARKLIEMAINRESQN